MDRWTSATAQFWRTEPGRPLLTLVVLIIAQAAFLHLAGRVLHHGSAYTSGPVTVGRAQNAAGAILLPAWFTWRIWRGGHISWFLSLVPVLAGLLTSAVGSWHEPGVVLAGCLLFYLAFTALLLMPPVLQHGSQPPHTRRARRRLAATARGCGEA
jgi:hypothetical protein